MKYTVCIFLLVATNAWAGSWNAVPHPGATWTVDPTLQNDAMRADAQAGINSSLCVDGDIILLPAGTFTWTARLTNVVGGVRKNVKIRGAGMENTHLIKGTVSEPLIVYTNANNKTTSEVSGLSLDGEFPTASLAFGTSKLAVNGEHEVFYSNTNSDPNKQCTLNTYCGGMVVHDVKWTTPYRLGANSETGTGLGGMHMYWTGYVHGVMYHCVIDDQLQRQSNETMEIIHNTDPNGVGDFGDYSHSLPTPLATKDMLYAEDNIWHHMKAITDSGDWHGGGMLCSRHNTSWGSYGCHGTRESNGPARSFKLQETYNNLAIFDFTDPNGKESGFDTPGAQERDGEAVHYNNFTLNVATSAGQVTGVKSRWTFGADCGGVSTVNSTARWAFGADGINPWDNNQHFEDCSGGTAYPNCVGATEWWFIDKNGSQATANNNQGFTHYVDKTYNSPTGTVNSPNSDVQNGLSKDRRFSDVWAHVSDGSCHPDPNPAQSADVTRFTCDNLQGNKLLPSPLPGNTSVMRDYFRGFILRNADADFPRSARTPISFEYIQHSWWNGGTSWTFTTQTATPFNRAGPIELKMGTNMEIRRIKEYMGVPSRGQTDARPAGDPGALPPPASPAQRWMHEAPFGIWHWGCMIGRLASQNLPITGVTWVPEATYGRTQASYGADENKATQVGSNELVVTNFHVIQQRAQDVDASTNPGIAGLKLADGTAYPWVKNVAAGSDPATRVGADWTYEFVTPFPGQNSPTGVPYQNDCAGLAADTCDGGKHKAFASFYSQGAGGFQYPHPLRPPAGPQKPVFDTSSTVSPVWKAGVPSSWVIKTHGSTVPTLAPFPTPIPAGANGWSFGPTTPPQGGQAMLSASTPVATVNPYQITIRATNTVGTTDQILSVPVVTNVAPVVVSFGTDKSTYTAGDTVALTTTASDSDGTVNKIEWYESGNPTQPIATLSPTTPTGNAIDYKANWSGVAAGSYSLTTKVYDNDGSSTVSTPPVSITVNAAPGTQVSLTSPVGGTVYDTPAQVDLEASASAPSGISKVEFYYGTSPAPAVPANCLNCPTGDLTSPYTFSWTGVTTGTYYLMAKAYNAASVPTNSDTVAISVVTPPPPDATPTPANMIVH